MRSLRGRLLVLLFAALIAFLPFFPLPETTPEVSADTFFLANENNALISFDIGARLIGTDAMIGMVREWRFSHGAKNWWQHEDNRLMGSSLWYADHFMLNSKHIECSGRGIEQRLKDFGVPSRGGTEIIYWERDTNPKEEARYKFERALSWWQGSSDHRPWLNSGDYRKIGAAANRISHDGCGHNLGGFWNVYVVGFAKK